MAKMKFRRSDKFFARIDKIMNRSNTVMTGFSHTLGDLTVLLLFIGFPIFVFVMLILMIWDFIDERILKKA